MEKKQEDQESITSMKQATDLEVKFVMKQAGFMIAKNLYAKIVSW